MKHSTEKINFLDTTVRLKNNTVCYDIDNRTLLSAVPWHGGLCLTQRWAFFHKLAKRSALKRNVSLKLMKRSALKRNESLKLVKRSALKCNVSLKLVKRSALKHKMSLILKEA